MIKFFRHIRQKLIDSGSVTKYLLYASGEILLVVLGILIALQVNNWNEKRVRQADERELLINVKTDFVDAVEELSYLNSLRSDMTQIINDFVTVGPHPDERHSEAELDSLFAILFYAPTFNNQSGSLDALLNSARINLVTDDSLRAMLLNWPGLVEDMIEGEVDQKQIQIEKYAPLIMKYLSLNRIYQKFAMESIGEGPFEVYTRETRKEPKYRELFRDSEFENILIRREFFLMIASTESESLINQAKRIIERIDIHISR